MRIKIQELKAAKFSLDIYNTTPTQDLINSIKTNGVLVPIWISPDNTIISGHRRVNACSALGIEEIDAEVREYSDLLVIEANRYREKTWKEKLRETEELKKILRPKAEVNLSLAGQSGKPYQKSEKVLVEQPINTLKMGTNYQENVSHNENCAG